MDNSLEAPSVLQLNGRSKCYALALANGTLPSLTEPSCNPQYSPLHKLPTELWYHILGLVVTCPLTQQSQSFVADMDQEFRSCTYICLYKDSEQVRRDLSLVCKKFWEILARLKDRLVLFFPTVYWPPNIGEASRPGGITSVFGSGSVGGLEVENGGSVSRNGGWNRVRNVCFIVPSDLEFPCADCRRANPMAFGVPYHSLPWNLGVLRRSPNQPQQPGRSIQIQDQDRDQEHVQEQNQHQENTATSAPLPAFTQNRALALAQQQLADPKFLDPTHSYQLPDCSDPLNLLNAPNSLNPLDPTNINIPTGADHLLDSYRARHLLTMGETDPSASSIEAGQGLQQPQREPQVPRYAPCSSPALSQSQSQTQTRSNIFGSFPIPPSLVKTFFCVPASTPFYQPLDTTFRSIGSEMTGLRRLTLHLCRSQSLKFPGLGLRLERLDTLRLIFIYPKSEDPDVAERAGQAEDQNQGVNQHTLTVANSISLSNSAFNSSHDTAKNNQGTYSGWHLPRLRNIAIRGMVDKYNEEELLSFINQFSSTITYLSFVLIDRHIFAQVPVPKSIWKELPRLECLQAQINSMLEVDTPVHVPISPEHDGDNARLSHNSNNAPNSSKPRRVTIAIEDLADLTYGIGRNVYNIPNRFKKEWKDWHIETLAVPKGWEEYMWHVMGRTGRNKFTKYLPKDFMRALQVLEMSLEKHHEYIEAKAKSGDEAVLEANVEGIMDENVDGMGERKVKTSLVDCYGIPIGCQEAQQHLDSIRKMVDEDQEQFKMMLSMVNPDMEVDSEGDYTGGEDDEDEEDEGEGEEEGDGDEKKKEEEEGGQDMALYQMDQGSDIELIPLDMDER